MRAYRGRVSARPDRSRPHQRCTVRLRNWVIFCTLIAAFEIVGVFAVYRFGGGDAADDEESNILTTLLVDGHGDERLLYANAVQREGYVVTTRPAW